MFHGDFRISDVNMAVDQRPRTWSTVFDRIEDGYPALQLEINPSALKLIETFENDRDLAARIISSTASSAQHLTELARVNLYCGFRLEAVSRCLCHQRYY